MSSGRQLLSTFYVPDEDTRTGRRFLKMVMALQGVMPLGQGLEGLTLSSPTAVQEPNDQQLGEQLQSDVSLVLVSVSLRPKVSGLFIEWVFLFCSNDHGCFKWLLADVCIDI